MQLINEIKQKLSGYTAIPNELIYDSRLSANAKGLYCYLASRPDDWQFFMEEIQSHFPKGIKSAIKELESTYWLVRKREPIKGHGKGFCWVWVLAAEPFTKEKIAEIMENNFTISQNLLSSKNYDIVKNAGYNNTESRDTKTDNTPPYNSPQGDSQLSFIDLWNRFADLYAEDYPGNQPIAIIKSTTEIPNLGARTKELNKLVKDLLSCDPDNIIRRDLEKRNNDVWYWAFTQIWRKIKRSRFLRGECPTTDAHPKPFRFNVQFLMRKQNFIRMVSPNDTAFLD